MVKLDELTGACAPKQKESLDDPIRHLHACHRRIEDRLKTLERVAQFFAEKPEAAAEALHACFRFFDTNGAWHTEDEEKSVFPRLLPALSAGEQNGLRKLEAEHQSAEHLYSDLKLAASTLTANETAMFSEAVRAFCAHYREHIQFEEPLLDSVAAKLNRRDLDGIAAEMKERRGLQ